VDERLDERVHRPYKVALLAQTLADEGVSVAALLAGSGIDEAMLHDAEARVSVRQLLAVLERAGQLARSPDWALRAGLQQRITHFGLYGYALLASPTPQHAIDFAIKYRALASPLIGLRFARDGDEAVWSFTDVLRLGPCSRLLRHVIELQLGTQLALHRDLLGATVAPRRVRLSYPAPAHAALYGRRLDCKAVAFDSGADELRFDAAWLDRPLAAGNAITAAMAGQTCDRLLAEMQAAPRAAARSADGAKGVGEQVIALLLARPGQFPDIEQVAASLGTSARTLRRWLTAEGRSFQQLLDDVRHQLAQDYLSRTRMNTEDIAAALGYSDAANFRQAFKRWSGRTPGAWRLKPPARAA
jgi:AraC-like DNA-binding protein